MDIAASGSTQRPVVIDASGRDSLRARRRVATAATGAIFLAGAIAMVVSTPTFFTLSNMLTVVRAAAVTGIAALGMTFITISGNYFSLSVEQTAAFTAIVFAIGIHAGLALPLALLITFLVAGAIGLAQGATVALGANPIITTLGAGAVLYGLSAIVTNNKIIELNSHQPDFLGQGLVLGVPTQTYAFLMVVIVAELLLVKSRFGRQIILVGANRAAARATGLAVGLAITTAFILSSGSAAVAGILVAAQFGQGIVNQFENFNTDVIAAVLVAGNSVQGGEGSALRTALGAIFIALLVNFTLLRGYPYGIRIVLEGLAILIAVTAYHVARRGAR